MRVVQRAVRRGVRGPHVVREDRVAVGRLRRGRQPAECDGASRRCSGDVVRRDRRPGRSQLCLKSYRPVPHGQRRAGGLPGAAASSARPAPAPRARARPARPAPVAPAPGGGERLAAARRRARRARRAPAASARRAGGERVEAGHRRERETAAPGRAPRAVARPIRSPVNDPGRSPTPSRSSVAPAEPGLGQRRVHQRQQRASRGPGAPRARGRGGCSTTGRRPSGAATVRGRGGVEAEDRGSQARRP